MPEEEADPDLVDFFDERARAVPGRSDLWRDDMPRADFVDLRREESPRADFVDLRRCTC